MSKCFSAMVILLAVSSSCAAFGITTKLPAANSISAKTIYSPVRMSQKDDTSASDGVIELVEGDETTAVGVGTASKEKNKETAAAPFLSQGEIQEETLKIDITNPKQTRVIIYIILSLLPVLFLIPLMLGSREFLPAVIPMDDLPPVQM